MNIKQNLQDITTTSCGCLFIFVLHLWTLNNLMYWLVVVINVCMCIMAYRVSINIGQPVKKHVRFVLGTGLLSVAACWIMNFKALALIYKQIYIISHVLIIATIHTILAEYYNN